MLKLRPEITGIARTVWRARWMRTGSRFSLSVKALTSALARLKASTDVGPQSLSGYWQPVAVSWSSTAGRPVVCLTLTKQEYIMNFGQALEQLKAGATAQREGWNGKGLTIRLQAPDADSKMTLPYLYLSYPATPASDTAPANHINANVPWLPSQTDILAEDWHVIA